MIRPLLYISVLTVILSSCSNFLTWHLDRGIHKASNSSSSEDISKSEDTTESDLSSDIQKLENLLINRLVMYSNLENLNQTSLILFIQIKRNVPFFCLT